MAHDSHDDLIRDLREAEGEHPASCNCVRCSRLRLVKVSHDDMLRSLRSDLKKHPPNCNCWRCSRLRLNRMPGGYLGDGDNWVRPQNLIERIASLVKRLFGR